MRRPFSSSAASSSPVDENAVTVKADVEVGGDGDARKMHTRPSLDAVGGESKSLPETPRTVVVRCLGGAIANCAQRVCVKSQVGRARATD